ncbi:hypothetical protein F8144_31140 [Streptomyces triticiradicis]|uniref:Uncharacterized protein n=1 Tax=Streptomyces triticiradicis TaxID=2651189 RepID=A0A7J5D7S7_9ACTN|nr:hypothetical protein F8144_31140 [Streptomyces triticiradicis]
MERRSPGRHSLGGYRGPPPGRDARRTPGRHARRIRAAPQVTGPRQGRGEPPRLAETRPPHTRRT